jgi:predicted nucleic acid-binding protein
MKYIDSNIFAYAFYNNEHQHACQQAIRDGGVTNTINLIEAFHIIELQTSRDLAIRAIKGLLKSNIAIIDADINVLFEAVKKAEKYKKLKILDLLHYVTAKSHDCNFILSYDKDFDALEIQRLEP